MANEIRLTKIDATNIGEHSHLLLSDECYFLFEYTSHKNYTFSKTNSLISNLKKKPSTAHTPAYKYKRQAIRECGDALRATTNPDWLSAATLVPVPCSKAADHPDFDDRIVQICRLLSPIGDVRSIIRQTASMTAAHEAGSGERITIEELLAAYRVDETLAVPAPKSIGIVDDVLTSGTHFRAMSTVLANRFPGVPIVGLFIARRVFPEEERLSPFGPIEF